MDYNIICPCYWVNEDLIEDNIKSWISEIKPKRILLGVNRNALFPMLVKLQKKYPLIVLIDQTDLKTLGGCLAELMKLVKTPWFVFVHSDVMITPYAFLIMQQYQKEDVGIIESHRELWDGDYFKQNGSIYPLYKPSTYYFRDRAYSGVQLMQLEAIKSLVDRLDDDYIYRNEDLVFHAECCKNGYKYHKTWAIHIHQILNKNWTYNNKEAHRMQYRGLIKYTEPNEITLIPCIDTIRHMKETYKENLNMILPFCYEYSPAWAEKIVEVWDSL
jgi:hypothetical protein